MKQNKDLIGDTMKQYEATETERYLDISQPIYARLDGRSFSNFTKGMDKPFDLRMRDAMAETAQYLVQHANARIGYTQSDEISLFWMQDDSCRGVLFDGKTHKMTSVLAAMATAKFVSMAMNLWPERCVDRLPHFDCRICNLPDMDACADMFLWRVKDARKNSINLMADAYFDHKTLKGIGARDRLTMLREVGVDWFELSMALQEGSWVRRVESERGLTEEEWNSIPEKHRPPRDTLFKRSKAMEIEVPSFLDIVNKQGFLLGEDPVAKQKNTDKGRTNG